MTRRAAPSVIETARLLLRPPAAEDVEAIFTRYAADPDVTRYLSWPRHQSVTDTQLFLDFSRVEWKLQGCGPYLVLSRHSGILLGATGISIAGEDHAVTGYVFARDAWGFGYATEALLAMVALGRSLGLRELHAQCHPDHHASRRVLTKGGFTLEHRSPAAYTFPNLSPSKQDVLSYAIDLYSAAPPG